MMLPEDFGKSPFIPPEYPNFVSESQKALEDLALRQMTKLCEREEQIYGDVMSRYMPPELFAKVGPNKPIDPDVSKWLQDNGWQFHIMPIRYTPFWLAGMPGAQSFSEEFIRKEVRRGDEVIATHYFKCGLG